MLKRNNTTFIAGAMIVGAAVATAAPAFAGECPADQIRPHTELNGPTAPENVTDTVVEQIDLQEQTGIEGRMLRIRRVEIQPGGIVPQHSHAERPAHLYIAEGEATEHRNTCAVPIIHRQGDVIPEPASLVHWWRNDSSGAAVIYSTDIVPGENPPPSGDM